MDELKTNRILKSLAVVYFEEAFAYWLQQGRRIIAVLNQPTHTTVKIKSKLSTSRLDYHH